MISPDARRGRYFCSCSSVPSMTMRCEPMPLFVPISERKAGEVRAISNANSTSSSMVSASPPYSSGMHRPKRPSSRICSTTFPGTLSVSASSSSNGISCSRTKRDTLSSSRPNVSSSLIILFLCSPGLRSAHLFFDIPDQLDQPWAQVSLQLVVRQQIGRPAAVERHLLFAPDPDKGHAHGADLRLPFAQGNTEAQRLVVAECLFQLLLDAWPVDRK